MKFLFNNNRKKAYQRLLALDQERERKQEIDWSLAKDRLRCLGDRFGKAGFYSQASRKFFLLVVAILFFSVSCAIFLFFAASNFKAIVIGFVVVFYLMVLSVLMFLKYRAKDLERETLFRLPLFLESVILLVESGLGVLPAVQKVVESAKKKNQPVAQVMQAVYELSSAGLPFGQALELVAGAIDSKPLRHVLLHLDVSSSEGGALVPSLRSLAEYAHREWKISVEARVKGLENAVVFPVFAAVIGLMLLVVAVPIVPIVDFFSSLDRQQLEKVGQ